MVLGGVISFARMDGVEEVCGGVLSCRTLITSESVCNLDNAPGSD